MWYSGFLIFTLELIMRGFAVLVMLFSFVLAPQVSMAQSTGGKSSGKILSDDVKLFLEVKKDTVDIREAKDCDPNLFAARLIATIQNRVVNGVANMEVSKLLAMARGELEALEKAMSDVNKRSPKTFSPKVIEMNTNALNMVKSFQKHREALANADEEGRKYVLEKTAEVVLETLDDLVGGFSKVKSWQEGIAIGGAYAIAYGGAYVWYSFKADDIKSEKVKGILEAMKKLPRETVAANKKLVEECAKDSSASRAEWGYDISDEESTKSNSDKLEDKIEAYTAWSKRRGRDPFVNIELCGLHAAKKDVSDEQLMQLAQNALDAARQVPDFEEFKRYKIQFTFLAGSLASWAARRESFNHKDGRFASDCESGRLAASIWNTTISITEDENGYLRMQQGIALGVSGRLDEGYDLLRDVAKIRGNLKCPRFAYNYAAMASRKGDTKTAFEWLKYGFDHCGLDGIDWKFVQSDPDFKRLRDKYDTDLEKIRPAK